MKPNIAITLDAEEAGGYSRMPWYALRQNYCSAVVAAGGIPIPLSHEFELIDHFVKLCDGFVITGGAFDIDPTLYGEEIRHPTVKTKPQRTLFEQELLKRVYQLQKPILGICGGMQLLNVIKGGTLIQHIPDEIENALPHEQPHPRTNAGHTVYLEPDSCLFNLLGMRSFDVNSGHHQAVKTVAPSLRVNAKASDGVIEGIEDPNHKFCIGVQWHPEYRITPHDQQLLCAFVEASQSSCASQNI